MYKPEMISTYICFDSTYCEKWKYHNQSNWMPSLLVKAFYRYLELHAPLLQHDNQDLEGSDRDLCLKLAPAAVFSFPGSSVRMLCQLSASSPQSTFSEQVDCWHMKSLNIQTAIRLKHPACGSLYLPVTCDSILLEEREAFNSFTISNTKKK